MPITLKLSRNLPFKNCNVFQSSDSPYACLTINERVLHTMGGSNLSLKIIALYIRVERALYWQ